MIQGSSRFVYRIMFPNNVDELLRDLETGDDIIDTKKSIFISYGIYNQLKDLDGIGRIRILHKHIPSLSIAMLSVTLLSVLHVDVNIVDGLELDIEAFKKWRNGEYADAEFILEDGKYICGSEVEKMSKSKYNTVNPDILVEKYGADTFRMYEMFLGPVEMSKPWDTKGIEGVHRFLRKLWRLFVDDSTPLSDRRGVGGEALIVTDEKPTAAELKVLHNTIKKIENDTERFSFNTAVSGFMIATNELTDLKCHKRSILEPLLILLAPYAPHISEELYAELRKSPSPSGEGRGEANSGEVSILNAVYPKFEEKYIKETSKAYPVAINGKTRTELTLALDATQQQVEEIVLKDEVVLKWLDGKQPKKIIYVKNKMINVVI